MNHRRRPCGLLVSVRNVHEAIAALSGGADVIDVKEPGAGSLGAALPSVVADVRRAVRGKKHLSAAAGELCDFDHATAIETTGLSWIKFGLAGSGNGGRWREQLLEVRDRIESVRGTSVVAVAYADWRRANAPTVMQVASFAEQNRFSALLIDTHIKDGDTLLDWMTLCELAGLLHRMGRSGIPVALAGSIGRNEIRALLPLRPTWIAVRGAVCRGDRLSEVSSQKVRELAELIHGETRCAVQ